jgi:hypothetical protein
MRRNQNSNNKSKNADKGKDKHQTLDTSDLLIESRLVVSDLTLSSHFTSLPLRRGSF